MALVTRDQKKFIISELNALSFYDVKFYEPLPPSIRRAQKLVDDYTARCRKRDAKAKAVFIEQKSAVLRALNFASAQEALKKLDAFKRKYKARYSRRPGF